jgi:hypothetical protein
VVVIDTATNAIVGPPIPVGIALLASPSLQTGKTHMLRMRVLALSR